jgi:hypothetical protein
LAAGDEHALCVGKRGGGRPGIEASVQRDIARRASEPLELVGGDRQQRVFASVAELGGGGEQQAARAAAGVLGDLGQLEDVAELGRGPELALADRARVRVEH